MYWLALLATAAPARTVLWWLEPYANLTSVAAYQQAWHQWKDNKRDGYIVAGSAYAAKVNGSLGYATTKYGEGENGILMEKYGFPALKSMGLRTIAMVYVTHYKAIEKVVADPDAFVAQLMEKAKEVGIDGYDIDYEPQGAGGPLPPGTQAGFMDFMKKLAAASHAHGLTLTIDIFGCPNSFDFNCAQGYQVDGLLQANTMTSFGVGSVDSFKQAVSTNHPLLHEKWAPGFEPHGSGQQAFTEILQYMHTSNISTLATWEWHEGNTGDQPQWLFDTVNAYLDGEAKEIII